MKYQFFDDYAKDYEDFVHILEQDLPEYKSVQNIPKNIFERKFKNVNQLFPEESNIFDIDLHWHGMPKYSVRKINPMKELVVKFATEEDLLKFKELVGQSITLKTKSIWFPEKGNVESSSIRWIYETEASD